MTALTVLAAEANYDTATGLAIIILSLIGLAFWAASEALLTRQRRDPLGIARAVGVLDDRRTPGDRAAFANAVEDELAARRNGGAA